MLDGFATFLRIILIVGTIIATLVFLLQVVRAWRVMSYGQKMFVVAMLCFLVYIIDANRAALVAGLHWNLRLAPLAVGLASFAAYLMEPTRLKRQRFGRPQVTSGPPDDPEGS